MGAQECYDILIWCHPCKLLRAEPRERACNSGTLQHPSDNLLHRWNTQLTPLTPPL